MKITLTVLILHLMIFLFLSYGDISGRTSDNYLSAIGSWQGPHPELDHIKDYYSHYWRYLGEGKQWRELGCL